MRLLICNPISVDSTRPFIGITDDNLRGSMKRQTMELLSNIKESQFDSMTGGSPAARVSHRRSSTAIISLFSRLFRRMESFAVDHLTGVKNENRCVAKIHFPSTGTIKMYVHHVGLAGLRHAGCKTILCSFVNEFLVGYRLNSKNYYAQNIDVGGDLVVAKVLATREFEVIH